MATAALVTVAVTVGAVLASWFMWRATERSAVWAMAAGLVAALLALAAAIVIAWLMTRAAFGSQARREPQGAVPGQICEICEICG